MTSYPSAQSPTFRENNKSPTSNEEYPNNFHDPTNKTPSNTNGDQLVGDPVNVISKPTEG